MGIGGMNRLIPHPIPSVGLPKHAGPAGQTAGDVFEHRRPPLFEFSEFTPQAEQRADVMVIHEEPEARVVHRHGGDDDKDYST